MKGLKSYLVERINSNVKPYDEWFKEQQLTEKEIEMQKHRKFDYQPKISIVVPTYNTPLKFLQEMIESVQNRPMQTGNCVLVTEARVIRNWRKL